MSAALIHLGLVEARPALVGQQKLGAVASRLGQLELLQSPRRPDRRRWRAGRSARPTGCESTLGAASAWNGYGRLASRLGRRSRPAPRLEDGEPLERPRDLEGAPRCRDWMMRCEARPPISRPSKRSSQPRRKARQHVKIVLLPDRWEPIRRESHPDRPERYVADGRETAETLDQPFDSSTAAVSRTVYLLALLRSCRARQAAARLRRCAWLLGHTTYDLSSTYWMITRRRGRSGGQSAEPSPLELDAKAQASCRPPDVVSSAAAQRFESIPPLLLIARGSTSVRNRKVLDAAMPTCAERMATPGFTLSNSSPTYLISGAAWHRAPSGWSADRRSASV